MLVDTDATKTIIKSGCGNYAQRQKSASFKHPMLVVGIEEKVIIGKDMLNPRRFQLDLKQTTKNWFFMGKVKKRYV